MRHPQGYAIWTEGDGSIRERDTFTCCHCNHLVFVKPKCNASDAGGFCRCCMSFICGPCADKGTCEPFLKKIEKEERKGNLLRSILG